MNIHTKELLLGKFLIILLLTLNTSAFAEVYKWTDENGKVHYSDKPIDDKSQQLKMKRQPSASEISKAKLRASSLVRHQSKVRAIIAEETRDKQLTDEKTAQKERKTSQLCKKSKRNILRLSSGRRAYTTDKAGNRHYLSDQEKNDDIAKLKVIIDKSCKIK